MANKDNSGVLFPNRKKTSDKHPNLKGTALIEGVEYWVSGWVNKDSNQQKYISLKFQLKGEGKSKVQQKLDKANKELDDNIPF